MKAIIKREYYQLYTSKDHVLVLFIRARRTRPGMRPTSVFRLNKPLRWFRSIQWTCINILPTWLSKKEQS